MDKNFCYASDSVHVRFITRPSVNLGIDTVLCLDKKLILHAQVEEGSYIWQDGSFQKDFVVQKTGLYHVTIKNTCGFATSGILVHYEDCHQVYIPNAFSPNGDGQNDAFMIYDGGDVKLIHRLEIYDRWGGLVYKAENFKPNDLNFAWHGDKFAKGVYAYFAEIEYKDGEIEIKKGDVTIL